MGRSRDVLVEIIFWNNDSLLILGAFEVHIEGMYHNLGVSKLTKGTLRLRLNSLMLCIQSWMHIKILAN
jgi:hypothetical protein